MRSLLARPFHHSHLVHVLGQHAMLSFRRTIFYILLDSTWLCTIIMKTITMNFNFQLGMNGAVVPVFILIEIRKTKHALISTFIYSTIYGSSCTNFLLMQTCNKDNELVKLVPRWILNLNYYQIINYFWYMCCIILWFFYFYVHCAAAGFFHSVFEKILLHISHIEYVLKTDLIWSTVKMQCCRIF